MTQYPIIYKNLLTKFIAVLVTIAKKRKQLNCPSVSRWVIKCGTYTLWIFFSCEENWNCKLPMLIDGTKKKIRFSEVT